MMEGKQEHHISLYDMEKARYTLDKRQANKSTMFSRQRKLFLLLLFLASGYGYFSFYNILGVTKVVDSLPSKDSLSQTLIELPHEYQDQYDPVPLNRTLGFEKVFVLNLDRRQDRHDLMSLMGLLSDIDFQYITASDTNRTQEVRLPKMNLHPQFEQDTLTEGQLACYRSNLNIMRKIVEERIESALIIQDDAEWDIDFKKGMERLQGPFLRLLQGLDPIDAQQVRQRNENNPWLSKEWDIFWLGGSDEKAWPKRKGHPDPRPYVIYDDDLVAEEENEEPGGRKIFPNYGLQRYRKEGDARQRIVQKSRFPVGMVAYAVTLTGAAQILAHASYQIRQPFDLTVCALSRVNNPLGYPQNSCLLMDPIPPTDQSTIRSYSVWPPFVTQFRSADGQRDSDLTSNRKISTGKAGKEFGFGLEMRTGVREQVLARGPIWRKMLQNLL